MISLHLLRYEYWILIFQQQLFSPLSFTNQLIKWIVMDDQPFTTVESAEIRKLFLLLNPAAITISADTIRSHIMDAFVLERTKVRDILQVYINLALYHYMYLKSTNSFKLECSRSYLFHTWYLDISKCHFLSWHHSTLDWW